MAYLQIGFDAQGKKCVKVEGTDIMIDGISEVALEKGSADANIEYVIIKAGVRMEPNFFDEVFPQ